MDTIIEGYFRRGFTQSEILTLLDEEHGIEISLRTLQRTLARNQLWRRRNKTDVVEVAEFIHQQLQMSGQQHGYRWMHQKCWIAGIITDRETVRLLLRVMDGGGSCTQWCMPQSLRFNVLQSKQMQCIIHTEFLNREQNRL